MKPHRIPQLDGLRGIAILMIVVWHCFAPLIRIPRDFEFRFTATIAAQTLQAGWSGVDLFFVLSGFLIGGILWDHREAPNYFRVFYERRFWRIVPAYLIWIALMPITAAVFAGRIPDQVHYALFGLEVPIWVFFTFTQNIAHGMGFPSPRWLGVTWSLAVEEQFYLTIPILIRFVPRHRLMAVLSGLALISMVARIVLRLSGVVGGMFGYVMVFTRADALLIGVMCALLMRDETVRDRIRQHHKALYGLVGMLGIGIVAITHFSPEFYTIPVQAFGFSWYALLYALMLLIALTEVRGPIHWLTSLPPLRWLGVRAYGVYLSHMGIYLIAHAWITQHHLIYPTWPSWLISIGAVAVSLMVAALSWEFIEKPLVARGQRHQYALANEASLQATSEVPAP